MRTTILRLLAVASLAAACSSGSGSRFHPPGDDGKSVTPTGLTVEPAPDDPERVTLAWSADGTPDAWLLEASAEGGPWLPLDLWVPPEARSATAWLDRRTPDGVRSFRVRAVSQGAASAAAEASYVRALRAATGVVVWRGADGRHRVAWTPGSPNGLPLLYRRVVGGDGVAQPWLGPLPLEFDGTFVEDVAGWADGAYVEYRVGYALRDLRSAPASASGPQAPPLPLEGVTATVVGGAVRVAWTYPGVAPVDVTVFQRRPSSFPDRVGLASSPASSLDVPLPVPGAWTYHAMVTLHGAPSPDFAAGAPGATVLVPDAAWAGVVNASLRTLPWATGAARDSAGRFVLEQGRSDGFAVVLEDAGGPVTWDSPVDAQLVRALVDPADRVHVIYRSHWTTMGDLLHRWRDAGGWHEEPVAAAAGYGGMASLDRAGNPVVVWPDFSGGVAQWARVDAGAWLVEALPAAFAGMTPTSAMAFDPAGDPGLVLYGPTLVRRRAGGAWTSVVVPEEAVAAAARSLWLPAADRALVGYSTFGLAGDGFAIREWTTAGWGAPASIPTATYPVEAVAATPDASRIVIAVSGKIVVRENGAWRTILVANDGQRPAVGFTPAGKWWALFGLASQGLSSAPATSLYVLYEEP